MNEIISALLSEEVTSGDVAGVRLPEYHRGDVVRREDTAMSEGMDSKAKDLHKSLRVQEVATP